MIEHCTAVILAGGESKRMGEDKASLTLANDSLLHHAIHNLQPLFASLLVSVHRPIPQLSLPQLCDQGSARGPIMGIATALKQVTTPWLFVLACDMPLMTASVVRMMADRRADYHAVVPSVDGVLQPLAAFYSTECLPLMASHIALGHRSLQGVIRQLKARIIAEEEIRRCDPTLLSFMDIDTRDDAVRAEAILAKRKH